MDVPSFDLPQACRNVPFCAHGSALVCAPQLPLGLGTINIHGLECPATPGPVGISLEVTLPSIAPPGDYDISLAGSDENGSSVLCVDVKLEL